MSPNVNQLMASCHIVRTAAQQVSDDQKIRHFQAFPRGWCGCASRVLGTLLSSQFPDCAFFYVCGERPKDFEMESHAWVEYKNLVLDITADQFEDCNDPVIVKPLQESAFHQLFQMEQQRRLCSVDDVHYDEEGIVWREVCRMAGIEMEH